MGAAAQAGLHPNRKLLPRRMGPRAVVVPRPAISHRWLRALVFLRDGLATDSTERILPEVRRAAEVPLNTPTTLTTTRPQEARIMATFRYSVSCRPPLSVGLAVGP